MVKWRVLEGTDDATFAARANVFLAPDSEFLDDSLKFFGGRDLKKVLRATTGFSIAMSLAEGAENYVGHRLLAGERPAATD